MSQGHKAMTSLVDELDNCLPQTQCGECEFAGCKPYAEAMANGEASIDRCPPGGVTTLGKLATLLNVDPTPYLAKVSDNTRPPEIAIIDEQTCIGCTKCIQACPVDAIIGSGKLMHTVLTDLCTGCRLCVEPCPVDCIDMQPLEEAAFDKDAARIRFEKRNLRLKQREEMTQKSHKRMSKLVTKDDDSSEKAAKQAYIQAAMARRKGRQQ